MKKILIVDDKPENSYLLESLLKGNGYKIITAPNGAEALEIALKNRVDLIISDILMPVMDGFTFCRECKNNNLLKNTPFVFYTATYTSLKDEEFALSLGADKFILKPQDPDFFLEIIKGVLKEIKEEKVRPDGISSKPEDVILKEYNAVLIRKLEDKMTQAEEAEKQLREKNAELLKEIEERKRMEAEVRESEEKFRMIFENVLDGICIYVEDPDPFKRKLVDCNERYAIMSGRSREELLRLGNTQSLQITLEGEANKNRLDSLKKESTYFGSYSWIRPDGKHNVVEYVGRPIKWHGQSFSIGIDRDITERKLAESELRKLSRAVEQSPASVIITDTDGNIEYVNPKASETSGYHIKEVVGKNPRIFSSGEQSESDYKTLWDTIISGKEWRGELHNKKKNGELYWESASISPILNKKGIITNFVAVKEDITEHKKILQDLIAAKEKAEQSDKLKTEFLAQMSHEIRTPMNAIISFTDLLRDDYFEKNTQELSDILNSISNAGKRIIRTVSLILNASEMQIGTYQPSFKRFNLEENLSEVIQSEYAALARQKGLQFEFVNNSPSPFVYGDEYSINQIFINLIDNAVKYTESGKVDVLIDRNKGNNITVTIADTGIGISEEYLPQIFKPFMQEERGYSRRFEGNGLGLSLVKKYCDLNGINISVESKKRIGTRFTITFNNHPNQ
ncbi:MAG: PAS domain S-box protein [Ignavibacteriaceae bacterium]